MHCDYQRVAVFSLSQQESPHQWPCFQVEWPLTLPARQEARLPLPIEAVPSENLGYFEAERLPGVNDLFWGAGLRVHPESGAKSIVTAKDLAEATLENLNVERALQSQADGHVVGDGIASFHLVQKPQSLLRK
jgi:hypothetical protein